MAVLLLPGRQAVQPQGAAVVAGPIQPAGLFVGSAKTLDQGRGKAALAAAGGTQEATAYGQALRFNGSSDVQYWATRNVTSVSRTYGALFRFNSTPGGDASICGSGSTAGDGGFPYEAIGYDSATGKVGCFARVETSVGTVTYLDGPSLTVGKWYCVAVSINVATRALRLFVDGIAYGSATCEVDIGDARGNFSIGATRRATAAVNFAPASIVLAWFDNRVVDDASLLEWTRAPWRMLQAPQRRIWADVGGGTTNASIAAFDGADTTAIAATVTTGASIAAADGADVHAISAAIWTTAQIAAADGADVHAIATSVTTGAAIAANDGADVHVINASIGSTTSATIDAFDGADETAIVAANWTTAQIDAADGADVHAIGTSVTTGAALALLDGADVHVINTSGTAAVATGAGAGSKPKRVIELFGKRYALDDRGIYRELERRLKRKPPAKYAAPATASEFPLVPGYAAVMREILITPGVPFEVEQIARNIARTIEESRERDEDDEALILWG